ncbi:MAG: hypothetical protein WD534_03965 [Phycisphaeraceae bacterium]
MHSRSLAFAIMLLGLPVIVGCHQQPHVQPLGSDRYGAANETMMRMTFDQQVQNAIVTERTVYPHHFAADSPRLNALGQRQVAVLAAAFRDRPAEGLSRMNLSRGEAPDALYRARVQQVHAALAQHGVEPGRIEIVDEVPGGSGIEAERAADALEMDRSRTTSPSTEVPTMQTTTGDR